MIKTHKTSYSISTGAQQHYYTFTAYVSSMSGGSAQIQWYGPIRRSRDEALADAQARVLSVGAVWRGEGGWFHDPAGAVSTYVYLFVKDVYLTEYLKKVTTVS